MPKGPRRVWVRVFGEDDDLTIFAIWPPGTGVDVWGFPELQIPSTTGASRKTSDYAQVTDAFDIADTTEDTEFPIELATGDFALAFTVFARIKVDAFVPAAITIRELAAPAQAVGRSLRARQDEDDRRWRQSCAHGGTWRGRGDLPHSTYARAADDAQ